MAINSEKVVNKACGQILKKQGKSLQGSSVVEVHNAIATAVVDELLEFDWQSYFIYFEKERVLKRMVGSIFIN